MSRNLRLAGYVVLGLALALAAGAALTVALTRTQFGVERVGRFAVGRIQRQIEGDVRVGRITSRSLLGGAMLHDVALNGPQGRPFIRADSVRLTYSWRNLLAGRIVFDRALLYDPEVYLEKLPGDTLWNYDIIFGDTTPDEGDDGEDRLIQIERARIHDGLFVVRTPWQPDPGEPVEPDDTARLVLRAVPGGLVREMRFENVDARLPRVVWETPAEEGKLFRVASLSTRGYIWEDPFQLQEFEGTVTIRDSVIAFEADRFRLPASRGSAVGRIVTAEERTLVDVRIEGDDVAFSDLQWLYPPLPDEGGGSLVFRIQSQPAGTLWLAQDARLRAPGTEVAGTFGIVTGDTLYFTQVSLRASPLDLELLEEILPGELPVDGLMVGTVEVEGPVSSLLTRGNLRLVRAGAPRSTSAIRWSGTFDLREPYGVQSLEADIGSLDLTLLSRLRPELGGGGTVSGRIRATGRLDRALRFAASVNHQLPGGTVSALEGRGTLTRGSGTVSMDAELTAESVALEALAAVFPGFERLRGEARGPITVTGSLADLAVNADLATSAGRLRFEGRVDLTRPAPRYQVTGHLAAFRLSELVEGMPQTTVDARFTLDGAGVRLDSVDAGARIELDSARIGALALHSGILRLDVRDGIAHVDTLIVGSAAGRVEAHGALGLVAGRDGVLDVTLDADSLHALRGLLLPGAAPLAAGAEDPAADPVAGAARVQARIHGSLNNLRLQGEARLEAVTIDAITLAQGTLTFAGGGIGTDSAWYRLRSHADTLTLFDRRLASAEAAIDYAGSGGRFELDASAIRPRASEYRLAGEFRRLDAGITLAVDEAYAGTAAGEWALDEPARVTVGNTGIEVDELLLARSDGQGRVRVAGRLPWRNEAADPQGAALPAAFRIDIRRLPLFALRDSVTMEPAAHAILTGRVAVTGTAGAPRLDAELAFTDLRFTDTRLDRFDARLEYGGRQLDTRIEARHGGRPILVGEGRVPLDLRLMPVADRRLARPLEFQARVDSFPAAILATLMDGFHDVRGAVGGTVTIGGTTAAPVLGGNLALAGGEATWQASGVRYRQVNGTFRALGEQVVGVALNATTREGGGATVTGTLTFRPLSDPRFDLVLEAREFEAANRRDVVMVGTGEIRLTGRYTRPQVEGRITVDRGALYLDELWRQHQVVALDDPLLFAVVDTSIVAIDKILPTGNSAFLRNLVIRDVRIDVERDTWLRGRNLGVELAGQLQVDYDRGQEPGIPFQSGQSRGAGDLRLTGTLNAIRGYYELDVAEGLPIRRFAVREGTVEFNGTPGINPALDITAAYRVRLGTEPLNVQAVVTGTLRNPQVALRSDAEPPISESELLSYLLFGRTTSELAGAENRQLNQALYDLGRNVLTTLPLGYAAAGLQTFVSDLGIADYFAITEWEGITASDGDGWLNAFERQQVEVGWYLGDRLYAGLTRRLAVGGRQPQDVGLHLEWRFLPTWTAELFLEDRFARFSSFGIDLSQKKVGGFFLYREWGY